MPVDFSALLDNIASTSLTFMGDVISTYWSWILGLIVLTGLAYRFRSLVGLAR